MSHVTFNIADYRPIVETRIRTIRTQAKNAGFTVMTPARQESLAPVDAYVDPAVVNIRQVRDQSGHRGTIPYGVYQRRGKVLRFRGENPTIMNIELYSGAHAAVSEPTDLPPAA